MNDFADIDLQRLEELSAALLPASEIAILLDLDAEQQLAFVDVCKNHTASPVYHAYQKGRLTTKFELRKTVIKLAKAGSPAAEPLADKYLKDQKLDK